MHDQIACGETDDLSFFLNTHHIGFLSYLLSFFSYRVWYGKLMLWRQLSAWSYRQHSTVTPMCSGIKHGLVLVFRDSASVNSFVTLRSVDNFDRELRFLVQSRKFEKILWPPFAIEKGIIIIFGYICHYTLGWLSSQYFVSFLNHSLFFLTFFFPFLCMGIFVTLRSLNQNKAVNIYRSQ